MISPTPTTSNITSITMSYTKQFSPYTVKLNLVPNDYGYIRDYSKTILQTMFTKRAIATITHIIASGDVKCIPCNIKVYAQDPYISATGTNTSNYFYTKIYSALNSYFQSNAREFGEVISYPDLYLTAQNSDSRIKLVTIEYPTSNVKLNKTE
jgi:hypothetical protein